MFDTAEAADAGSTATLIAASHRAMVEHETRLLVMAAHWAGLHAAPPGSDWSLDPLQLTLVRPSRGVVRVVGGVGTPPKCGRPGPSPKRPGTCPCSRRAT